MDNQTLFSGRDKRVPPKTGPKTTDRITNKMHTNDTNGRLPAGKKQLDLATGSVK